MFSSRRHGGLRRNGPSCQRPLNISCVNESSCMKTDGAVMIVADIFPPVAEVGVYRTVALSRQLAEEGWKVSVVTAVPRADAFIDEAMCGKCPEAFESSEHPAPACRSLRQRSSAQTASCQAALLRPREILPWKIRRKSRVLQKKPSIGCPGGCTSPIRLTGWLYSRDPGRTPRGKTKQAPRDL